MDVMDFADESHEMGIRDGLAEMAQIDLDYPYQALQLALRNSGIPLETVEDVNSALQAQIDLFLADQNEWAKKVYNS